MVARELAPARSETATHAPHRGLAGELATAYTLGWTLLLLVAAMCAMVPAARWLAHHELALALNVRIRPAPAPSLGGAGWLLVNNLRATGWPLVAVALRAHRTAGVRRVVHAAVLVSLAANLLPVAAAIGVYRSQLVPYLPHLPLELYAITTSPATWVISTRQPVSRRQLAAVALTILAALAGAAGLETWAVPHR
jgi:hypothetical protein